MIAAVGARYSGNPLVKIAAASYANATSEDWGIPDGITVDEISPAGSTESSRMLAAGYTHVNMVYAGAQIIDAAMRAWPNQVVYTAVGGIHNGVLETDPDSVAPEVRDAARTKWGTTRLVIGKNAPPPLNGAYQVLYKSAPAIAGQNLWFCFQDPTYKMNGGTSGGLTDDQILRSTVDNGGLRYIWTVSDMNEHRHIRSTRSDLTFDRRLIDCIAWFGCHAQLQTVNLVPNYHQGFPAMSESLMIDA